MKTLSQDGVQASIQFTYDELALLYGALIEAAEALSPSEFHARVGRSEAQAERLRSTLKPILVAMDKDRS